MSKSAIFLGSLLLLFAPGCTGTPLTPTPEPPTTTPTAMPTPTLVAFFGWPTDTPVVMPNTPSPGSSLVTISGQVRDVTTSTRVIRLVKAVQGISSIIVTDKTQILASTGAARKLADIKAGALVEVTGTPGISALTAQRIRIMPAPTPLPSPTRPPPIAVSWDPVQVPDIQIAFEIPRGWPRSESDWSWTRPGSVAQRVGVKWRDNSPGLDPTIMVPTTGVVKSTLTLNTRLGRAFKYVVNVWQSTAQGRTLVAVETHLVVITDQRLIDLYAGGRTQAELDQLSPVLDHMQSTLATLP